MPRFNLNIERIVIDGDISILSDAVSEIDLLLQTMSTETEEMKSTLLRYSGSNQGTQYLKCASASLNLSRSLYDVAENLNILQRQVVEYCRRVVRFEELNIILPSPRPFDVQPIIVEVNRGIIRFDVPEMIIVRDSLRQYSENIREGFRTLNSHVQDIGSVWKDPQYKDFVNWIDEVTSHILPKCNQLEEYSDYLNNIIIHLTTGGV